MKYVKEFGIILIVSLVGELLNYFLPLPAFSSRSCPSCSFRPPWG